MQILECSRKQMFEDPRHPCYQCTQRFVAQRNITQRIITHRVIEFLFTIKTRRLAFEERGDL